MKYLIPILALTVGALPARSDVRLPAALGDRMVLQQQSAVSLWGWAYEGETVIVETSWGEKTQTIADARGEWRVKVKTPIAQPLNGAIHPEQITFTVPNENAVQIKDVLIGEVWLCSGQSNMTMMLGPDYPDGHNGWYGDVAWKTESGRTNRPALRVFNVEKTSRAVPQDDCKAVLPDHITLPADANGLTPDLATGWQICTPRTAPYISAVAYYFGAMLQEKLKVPVGLVTSAVGGSPIQAWISLEALHTLPDYEKVAPKVHRNGPAALFNGMIAPLTPMTVRGVIWYQGESNTGPAADTYADLLKGLIADWRVRFHHPELPFGIVQLANWGKPGSGHEESKVAVVREAQALVSNTVPDTGLAVAVDLGEMRIHPPNKWDVANRHALWARAKVYGEPGLVFQSPRCTTHTVEGAKIRVRFDTGGSPLIVGKKVGAEPVQEMPGTKLTWFEIADPNGKFVDADAVIDGDSVIVSATSVSTPVAVRYAWATNPDGCNLYSRAGLPASPFRTDGQPVQAPAGGPFPKKN